MLLSIYNNDIAITIYGWFGEHAKTCHILLINIKNKNFRMVK